MDTRAWGNTMTGERKASRISRRGLLRKSAALGAVTAVGGSATVSTASAGHCNLIEELFGPCNHENVSCDARVKSGQSIQAAIDNAQPSTTDNPDDIYRICVDDGTYTENISVDKALAVLPSSLFDDNPGFTRPTIEGTVSFDAKGAVLAAFIINAPASPATRITATETGPQFNIIRTPDVGVSVEAPVAGARHNTIKPETPGTGTGVVAAAKEVTGLDTNEIKNFQVGATIPVESSSILRNVFKSNTTGLEITGNNSQVVGNLFADNATNGVLVEADGPITGLDVRFNEFTGQHVGVLFFEDSGDISGTSVRKNDFEGNSASPPAGSRFEFVPAAGVAVTNGLSKEAVGQISGDIDARRNWWNAKTGPKRHVPRDNSPVKVHYTNGDHVTDGVSFRPWSTDPHVGDDNQIPELPF